MHSWTTLSLYYENSHAKRSLFCHSLLKWSQGVKRSKHLGFRYLLQLASSQSKSEPAGQNYIQTSDGRDFVLRCNCSWRGIRASPPITEISFKVTHGFLCPNKTSTFLCSDVLHYIRVHAGLASLFCVLCSALDFFLKFGSTFLL